jgi:AraC-like DNA-binding protein
MNFIKNALNQVINISKIVTILYFKFPKDFAFEGEKHNFWEFIYVDKGELIISADKNKYVLKSGELAFHRPNEFHDIKANGTVSPNVAVVSFQCESKCMRYFNNKIIFINETERDLLTKIISEGQIRFKKLTEYPPIYGMKKIKLAPFGADQMIKILLEQFLITIYRRGDNILKAHRPILSFQQNIKKNLVNETILLLEANINSTISINQISNKLGVSPTKVKKSFKEQTGQSIIDYLINLKIDEAKKLIKESSLNFTQIADFLGYDNVYYFSRIFKKRTDMTPTEYSLSVNK